MRVSLPATGVLFDEIKHLLTRPVGRPSEGLLSGFIFKVKLRFRSKRILALLWHKADMGEYLILFRCVHKLFENGHVVLIPIFNELLKKAKHRYINRLVCIHNQKGGANEKL